MTHPSAVTPPWLCPPGEGAGRALGALRESEPAGSPTADNGETDTTIKSKKMLRTSTLTSFLSSFYQDRCRLERRIMRLQVQQLTLYLTNVCIK